MQICGQSPTGIWHKSYAQHKYFSQIKYSVHHGVSCAGVVEASYSVICVAKVSWFM